MPVLSVDACVVSAVTCHINVSHLLHAHCHKIQTKHSTKMNLLAFFVFISHVVSTVKFYSVLVCQVI